MLTAITELWVFAVYTETEKLERQMTSRMRVTKEAKPSIRQLCISLL